MKKLSPFLYCNFFKLEKGLRTFVGVNQMGGRIFGHFWPDNPPPPLDFLASFGRIIRPGML
jgi:hypothetical protein